MRLKALDVLSGGKFRFYQRNSLSYHSKNVTLLVSCDATPTVSVGFIITRKVGSAVIRNKIRRRLRVIVCGLLPVCSQRAYILVAKPRSSIATFEELFTDFEYCLFLYQKQNLESHHVKTLTHKTSSNL